MGQAERWAGKMSECKVHLCEGGIFECYKVETQQELSSLRDRNTRLERVLEAAKMVMAKPIYRNDSNGLHDLLWEAVKAIESAEGK
jgi:hypothetical protein